MKSHARVVVIGGGVVGVSTLYHLARKGWTDCVLIERKELTSGSTWHAAGLLPLFNLSYSVGQIHKYSVALYNTLEAETGQPVGLKRVSNIRLARTPDRMDEFLYYKGIAETIGVRVNTLTPAEVKEIWPLANVEGILGAIQHPDDGYIQPADVTQALAKGARNRGAEIHRHTTVSAITRTRSGEWRVETDKGAITAEHIVCATGSFARQTGHMLGLDVPVIPVEHQYVVTEPHPAIVERQKRGLPEMGVLRESDSSWYMREENGGLILGPYEPGAPCCYVDGPSEQSEFELFQEDLERIAPHIETAIARVPAFGEVGIKKVYNGAICYTPDGSPIVGPAWDLKNVWLNEGHSFGITAAGGAGWQLAEWIVEGESSVDMLGVDPRRFGPYASRGYLRQKNEEAYANVFTMHYPDEERVAARPLKQAPCYDRMAALGAVFGSVYGWERPGWFAPAGYQLSDADKAYPDVLLNHNHPARPADGKPPREKWSFRRSNYFKFVGDECRHVSQAVGLQDMTPFAKYEVSGPGAEALARRPRREPAAAADRPHRPRPHAVQERRRAGRVHGVARGAGAVLSRRPRRTRAARLGLPEQGPPARRLGRSAEGHEPAGRPGARRPPLAGGAAATHRRRPVEQGVSLAHRTDDLGRRGDHQGSARQLRGRARLRAAPSDRDAELHLRSPDGRRASRQASVPTASRR